MPTDQPAKEWIRTYARSPEHAAAAIVLVEHIGDEHTERGCLHLAEKALDAAASSVGTGKLALQKARRSHNAPRALARIIKRELGVEVHPRLLQGFLARKFDLLSALAHQIHNEAEAER